tara:strand:- start:779 stop:1168 length:390 start_codon:yes stop_codon:yes gene_type:complete
MANALSNPTVEINDETIAIVPNSLTYKRGAGDVTVRTQSAGGDSVESVITEDAETKISNVKFSLLLTDKNLDFVRTWQGSRFDGGNTIKLSQRGSTQPLSFANMQVVSDPEYSVGADGSVEVEFMGDSA